MNIKVKRGDTPPAIIATFTDSDGAAVDLTDGTMKISVDASKSPATSTTPVISKTITSFNAPATGIQTIQLAYTDTEIDPAIYYYDIQFLSSSGIRQSTKTFKFEVIYDITQ